MQSPGVALPVFQFSDTASWPSGQEVSSFCRAETPARRKATWWLRSSDQRFPLWQNPIVTESDLIEAIKALVDAGEYRDEMPGKPIRDAHGPGMYRDLGDGRFSRCYVRGSPEYVEARDHGLIDLLPALEPASNDSVAALEKVVGAKLPTLLRRLYLEVGNGGFGPGYGLLSVDKVLEIVRSPWPSWIDLPLLMVCDWGCAISSLVDASDDRGAMWGFDPNPTGVNEESLFEENCSLGEWLERWVRGQAFQPVLVNDPDSGQWRGATVEEHAAWADEGRS